jgi:hypothetical protein
VEGVRTNVRGYNSIGGRVHQPTVWIHEKVLKVVVKSEQSPLYGRATDSTRVASRDIPRAKSNEGS